MLPLISLYLCSAKTMTCICSRSQLPIPRVAFFLVRINPWYTEKSTVQRRCYYTVLVICSFFPSLSPGIKGKRSGEEKGRKEQRDPSSSPFCVEMRPPSLFPFFSAAADSNLIFPFLHA